MIPSNNWVYYRPTSASIRTHTSSSPGFRSNNYLSKIEGAGEYNTQYSKVYRDTEYVRESRKVTIYHIHEAPTH